jgi:ferric-dicitrate binding protein FerR (iron transport regulator)
MATKHSIIWRRVLAIVLTAAIVPLPSLNAAPAPRPQERAEVESVGEVVGENEVATRNNTTLHKRDKINARDVLATNRAGRVRIVLRDGSTLSLGSNTRLTLLRHDRDGRESHMDLSMGRLRTQVVELIKDGGFFQLTTPHSNLKVVGTDFFVDVTPIRTRVVVYSGIVAVQPRNRDIAVSVAAGQSIEATPQGIGSLQSTSDDVERETIASTALDGEDLPQADVDQPESAGIVATPSEGRSNMRRNVFIGIAVGAAAAAGLAFAMRGDSDNSGRRPRSIPED